LASTSASPGRPSASSASPTTTITSTFASSRPGPERETTRREAGRFGEERYCYVVCRCCDL
jgi:hypothetical protein